MSELKLKKKINFTFQLHGYSLRSDSSQFLINQLKPIDCDQHDAWLDRIIEQLRKQSLKSLCIEKNSVEQAIKDCVREGFDENETIINVINAFEVPRLVFNSEKNKFVKEELNSFSKRPEIFGNSLDKANVFRHRYNVLFQRTSRSEIFVPTVIGETDERKFKLRTVEHLLSKSKKCTDIVLLGMLTQLKEGVFYIEDLTGALQLDLSEANYHTGLITENSFVLIEGIYEDQVFHVSGIGFPPGELSKNTRVFLGNINTFGGTSKESLKNSHKLLKYEKENDEAMFIFLSDLWLDDNKVTEKLNILFAGYSNCPPVAFVIMGNFLKSQYGTNQASTLKEKFKLLADMISQYSTLLENSKFIFIPGSSDPASPYILPRASIPDCLTEDIRRIVPGSIFTTNPCRIQYCTNEIVVIREDLVTKLCRNTINFPAINEIPEHFAATLVSQAHLTPLPLRVCPIYWAHDSSLHLYPLPDLVVVGDHFNTFNTKYLDCQIVNTGSFPKNEFCFTVYVPSTKQIEPSQITDDIWNTSN